MLIPRGKGECGLSRALGHGSAVWRLREKEAMSWGLCKGRSCGSVCSWAGEGYEGVAGGIEVAVRIVRACRVDGERLRNGDGDGEVQCIVCHTRQMRGVYRVGGNSAAGREYSWSTAVRRVPG